MSSFVKFYEEKGVFHLELHRKDKKNALNTEMYTALVEALIHAEQDPTVHIILFKGGNNCFCAGNDIADFLNEDAIAPGSPISNLLHMLVDIKKPMIAAVSGPAIGIGTTLLLHCDLVYATNNTVFSLPFVNLGVCAEAGSSYLLRQQIGHVKASELLMFGDAFDSDTALDCGIINEIVPEEEYWSYAIEKAEALAKKPQQSLLATKSLMKTEQEQLHAVIDAEIAQFSKLLKTEEAKAIFKRFLNK